MLYEQHKLPQERKQAHLHQHSSQPWQPVPQLLQWTCALIHSSLAKQTDTNICVHPEKYEIQSQTLSKHVSTFFSLNLLYDLSIYVTFIDSQEPSHMQVAKGQEMTL